MGQLNIDDPMTRVDPNLWPIPRWHADWDGEFQLAGLRSVAKALHDVTDLDARLSIIEEGYARLEIFDRAKRIGLVYVNRGDDRSVPLYTVYAGAVDDELTTNEVATAVRFLDQRRMALPEDAGRVLDYEGATRSVTSRPWMLLMAGPIPFVIEVVTIFVEATTGDPPNDLGEFKAYHYWTGAAVLTALAWFICTCFAFRSVCRWMLLISCGWFLWVCWVGYCFLRSLHVHPAGAYYRSLW